MKATAPLTPRLADPDIERVRREHETKIRELQQLPAASTLVISSVALVDGVVTTVSHSLGRAPRFVRESTPRGAVTAGFVTEVAGVDRTKAIQLKASGYGATITVDVVVM